MYKAVLFDLDGTLLNTSRDIQRCLNNALGQFSLPAISLEDAIKFVGNGAKALVERALPENFSGDFDAVYSCYRALFASCDNNLTTLYEGEEEALKLFNARGVKLAIVTNKPQDATDGVYEKLLKGYNFSAVLGGCGKYPLKPEPYIALAAAEILGVTPCECLFVGDGETDVITAQNAKMDCVSVLWGYRTKEQLKVSGATHFAESFKELSQIVLR